MIVPERNSRIQPNGLFQSAYLNCNKQINTDLTAAFLQRYCAQTRYQTIILVVK